MKKIFATLLVALGLVASNAASTACIFLMLDEPQMPKSMID